MAARKLGAYVSVAGGLYKGIERGEQLGINTIMIHPSAPQRWNTKPFDPEQIDKFNQRLEESDTVKHVFMHGIYLVNLANPDKQKLHLGKMSLVHYMDLAAAINSDGVMFHTGSLKDNEPESGYRQVANTLDWVVEQSESDRILMMEVAAGAGKVIGDDFAELAQIYDQVKHQDRIKFCLDTQHLWAAGYDIATNLDGVIADLDRYLGLDNVRCVHLNDSLTELGSNKDRHANLGEGEIGEVALKNFVNHPQLKHLPFTMETPGLKDFPDGAQSQVDKLNSWAE